jgi:hypothetical protein
MTADLPSKAGAKFEVQIATITIPYINDAEVRFCRFLEADHSTQIGTSQVHFYAQFGDTKAQWLDAPSVVHSEFEIFDYPMLPFNFNEDVYEKLKERSKSFVRFATEENRDTFIFDFVLTAKMTKDIKESSKSKKLMQIFNVSFDSNLQVDPTIAVSKLGETSPDLLFRSEYAGFIAYGLIEDHFAATVEEYEEQTCHDPIMQFAASMHYDPDLKEHSNHDGEFDSYLDRIRKRLQ